MEYSLKGGGLRGGLDCPGFISFWCCASLSWSYPTCAFKSCLPLNVPLLVERYMQKEGCRVISNLYIFIAPAPRFSWSEFLAQMLQHFCFRCQFSTCHGLIKCNTEGGFASCLMPIHVRRLSLDPALSLSPKWVCFQANSRVELRTFFSKLTVRDGCQDFWGQQQEATLLNRL